MNFYSEKRSHATHESSSDPEGASGAHKRRAWSPAQLLREHSDGEPQRLVVDTELLQANGTAQRDAALLMAARIAGTQDRPARLRQHLLEELLRHIPFQQPPRFLV